MGLITKSPSGVFYLKHNNTNGVQMNKLTKEEVNELIIDLEIDLKRKLTLYALACLSKSPPTHHLGFNTEEQKLLIALSIPIMEKCLLICEPLNPAEALDFLQVHHAVENVFSADIEEAKIYREEIDYHYNNNENNPSYDQFLDAQTS
tara:strand:+ start:103 stop:546 length:444 start_codon:yes stop_codon:yes gene_type:complete